MSRPMRALVPAELAVVAIAAASSAWWTLPVPVVIPLLVAASLSLWLRARSWTSVLGGAPLTAALGAAAGALGLALALVAGTPLVEAVTQDAVQWSTYPIVRGSTQAFLTVSVVVGLGALCAELVLRGWIVERVLELGGRPVLAIAVGAVAEAALADGSLAARLGAAVFGVAMGWMYVASGRRATAPICARVVFSLGALALEALRVVS